MNLQDLTVYPLEVLGAHLIILENGTRPTGGVGQVEEGIPSLGGEHLTVDGGFIFDNVRYVPLAFYQKMTRGIIQLNDILIVKDGATTGKVAFVRDDFPYAEAVINEHLYRLRPNEDLIDPEYLFWFLYSEWGQKQVQRSFQGAAIGGINQSFVDRIRIPLPPLPEQRRIVAILRKADELRQLRRNTLSILDKLYGSAFYHFFGDGRPTTQFSSTKKLKSLLKVPLSSGYSPAGSNINTGTPVFTLSALTDATMDSSAVKYYPVEEYSGKGDDLEVDDILISRSNTLELVGRVGRYQGEPDPVIYPDLMIRIRLKDPVDAPYLEGFLRSDFMKYTIRKLARGTSGSMKKISQGDINSFDVLWPPKDRRVKFGETIRATDILRQKQSDSNKTLNILFASLLVRAFTGELTAVWREVHAKELAKAAAERDRLLGIETRLGAPDKLDLSTEEGRDAFEKDVQEVIVSAATQLTASAGSPTALAESLQQGPVAELSKKLEEAAAQNAAFVDGVVTRSMQKLREDQLRSLAATLQPLRQVAQKTVSTVALKWAQDIAQLAAILLRRPDVSHPRYAILRALSDSQYLTYLAVRSAEGYVTVETLAEDTTVNGKMLAQDLELLAVSGLIQAVSVPTQPTGDHTVYVQAYRKMVTDKDDNRDSRSEDLAMLKELAS